MRTVSQHNRRFRNQQSFQAQEIDYLSPQQVIEPLLNDYFRFIETLLSILSQNPDSSVVGQALVKALDKHYEIFDRYIELESAHSKRVAEVEMKEAETGQSDSSSTEEI